MPTTLRLGMRHAGVTARPVAASALAPTWLHGASGPATVLAVGESAAYLGDGSGHRREVLALVTPAGLLLPGAVRVAAPADLHALRLIPGAEARVGEGQVRTATGALVVRRTWRPRRAPAAPLPRHAACRAQEALAPSLPLGAPLGPVADRGEALAAALGREGAGLAGPVAALVGLGPGLTPAGDDLLCGLLLGLRATGQQARQTALAAALAAALVPHLHRTTALSATLLVHAAGGHAVPAVLDLLEAWHRPGAPAAQAVLEVAAVPVARLGHTSGAALLLGLHLALRLGLEAPATPLPTPDPVG